MSRDISLQADIGALSLSGVEALIPLIKALSADNVAPQAVLQMAKLGDCFHVSGPYSEQVGDVLQWYGSVRLSRLASYVGWRKDDSASLMATSAGGQAIVLVCMCLSNLFREERIGSILYQLSQDLLPQGHLQASVSQLADFAQVISAKTMVLDFGRHLAQEVTRLYLGHTLAADGRQPPDDFLDPLGSETVQVIFKEISQVLRQEDQVCTITGTAAMGHVIGLLQALFPEQTAISILGVVYKQVKDPKIWCELQSQSDSLLHIRVATRSQRSPRGYRLPIERFGRHESDIQQSKLPYVYQWSGYIGSWLNLTFVNYGLVCEPSILDAFCRVVAWMPDNVYISSVGADPKLSRLDKKEPSMTLLSRLGPLPHAYISTQLRLLTGFQPAELGPSLRVAVQALQRAIDEVSVRLRCGCKPGSCRWKSVWSARQDTTPDCRLRTLWGAILQILEFSLWSLFIDHGPGAVIQPKVNGVRSLGTETAGRLTREGVPVCIRSDEVIKRVFAMFGLSSGSGEVLVCSKACTIYPDVLETLTIPVDERLAFKLVEGNLMFQGRPHTAMRAPAISEPTSLTSQGQKTKSLYPNNLGVAERVELTVTEDFQCLRINCIIAYENLRRQLNLRDVIAGFIRMRYALPCPHSGNSAIDTAKRPARATSVYSPATASIDEIGIVMTRQNAESQFLSCRHDNLAILQRDCCLNCAAAQVTDHKKASKAMIWRTIIVS